MGAFRELKRRIRKLIKKKPKGLNETKARAILLHLEGMKISEIAKILQVHKSIGGSTNSKRREKNAYSTSKEKEGT